MNQQVKRILGRASAAFGALGLGTALTVVSLLSPTVTSVVSAAASGGQVQTRSIKMSSSTPGATGQKYEVQFTASSTAVTATAVIKGIVVDFCAGDSTPIVGDTTCNTPSGFSASTSFGDLTAANITANPASVSGWTAVTANSGRTFKISNTTGVTLGAGAQNFDFELQNVTNPAQPNYTGGNGTFYARVVTYTVAAGDANFDNYAPGVEGSYEDYGGFALSTATNINITAKVQETLTFCTSGPSAPGGTSDPMDGSIDTSHIDCTTATAPNLTLGHGTPVATLNNSQIDAAYAFTQLSTNATTGAVIRMKAGNACTNAGLSTDGGTNCAIGGLGNTAAAPLAATIANTGSAAYGLYVGNSRTTTGVTASSGTIAPDGNYNGGVTHQTEGTSTTNKDDLWYGMDPAVATSTYGDTIAQSSLPLNTVNNTLIFGAIASLTTPAGIYQGSESLVATGTF